MQIRETTFAHYAESYASSAPPASEASGSGSPAPDTQYREQVLTQQIATQLTQHLDGIRQRITSNESSNTVDTQGVGSVLDIFA